MRINADFDQIAIVHSAEQDWIETRMPGVERRMLDRVGAETGHATSIVRYAAGSKFSEHVHTGGEEFLVLDGVFQDEHGDYPAGSYIRNPPQSKHTPGSAEGCTIFVKLWQFDPNDRTHVRTLRKDQIFINDPQHNGVSACNLYEDTRETVNIEHWAANLNISLALPDGAEILLLKGSLSHNGDTLKNQSWLRLPVNSHLQANTGPEGATVWIKTRHLAYLK